ncbi:MAG: alpha/beta hydrolase domain-containing protein [Acidimicrobiales bacterium]
MTTVTGPIGSGRGTVGKGRIVLGPPGVDLASVGYAEAEHFVSGTATSFTSDAPLASDGHWTVRPDATAPFTTRIVVRRPVDPARFDGTVHVEWLNVSGGLDAAPDWTYAHVGIIRAGAVWVGVSAQVVGIDGRDAADDPGSFMALKVADPERYGSLAHPGDDFSYDIFRQVGETIRRDAATVLGGLDPERVLAIGESQSAFRLSTYVDAVAPTSSAYDGFLLHSRAAAAAPLLLGRRVNGLSREALPPPTIAAPDPTLVRTDLTVPVLVLSSETDLVGEHLGYARARQPDSRWFRSWEVSGTAHGDAYQLGLGDADDGSGAADAALFAAMSDPPSSVYFGVITCGSPINAGPQTYVLRAALRALDTWVRTGEPPPSMPRLELDADSAGFAVDDWGNAIGGIRTPHVDAPVATLSGLGQSGDSFCALFGTTVPFDRARFAAAHGDRQTFLARWHAATDAAVDAGVILAVDGERIKGAAAASPIDP